jgi:uncharacterized protein YbjT (DUF2867 family)
MILVTGSTGKIGSEVVKGLAAKGEKVRALVRDPAKAKKTFGDAKVELVSGDMLKPESLEPALKGVDKLFLLAQGVDMPNCEANMIDAAKKAGVKHVVLLSVIGADMEPGITMGRWHRQGEKKLEASGMKWTFLRPSGFFANFLGDAVTIKTQGAFYAPVGDGKMGLIDPRDIAAVAVEALTGTGHEGKAYTLTGSESLSWGDVAAKITSAIGKPVKFVDVPPAAAQKGMLDAKMPPVFVDAYLELMGAQKAGYTAAVTKTVEEVIGKKPRTFDAWAKENAAAFK